MAKESIKIARRYARALLGLYDANQFETVRAALNEIAQTWSSVPELHEALLNPANSQNNRLEVLSAISQKILPGDQKFSNFLGVLLEKKRLSSIGLIAEAFSKLVDEIKKLLALKVVSATRVSDTELKNFQESLEKEFGALATVEWLVDPNIMGGMQVKSGDRLLDGSVRGALDRLQASLLNA